VSRLFLCPPFSEDISNGLFGSEPNCFNECIRNVKYQDYYTFSNADPGMKLRAYIKSVILIEFYY